MGISFKKIDLNVNIEPIKAALMANNELFGKFDIRRCDGSPHNEMRDIFLRFNDIKNYNGDRVSFCDEHDSVWYDTLKILPEVLDPVFEVMAKVRGERLGMVLITKLPPGGRIDMHKDKGWHASYYDKYYIPILNKIGADFCFEDDDIVNPKEGSVWWFDNSKFHWVENDSNSDRIAMIVCIKGGLCQ